MLHHKVTALISPPADQKDPEIIGAMIIKEELRLPDDSEMRGRLTEPEILKFQQDPKTLSTLMAMSELEQWVNWNTQVLIQMYSTMRQLDAEQAKRKIENAKLKAEQLESGWKWSLLKWVGVAIGAGIVSEIVRNLFK